MLRIEYGTVTDDTYLYVQFDPDVSPVDIGGNLTLPSGTLILDNVGGDPPASLISPLDLVGTYARISDDISSKKYIIHIDNIINDGRNNILTYTIDFARSYYMHCVDTYAGDPDVAVVALEGCTVNAASVGGDNWLKYKYVDIPVNGEKNVSVISGDIVQTPGGLRTLPGTAKNGYFLVVLKTPPYVGSSPGVIPALDSLTYVLIDDVAIYRMLTVMLSGDQPDPTDPGGDPYRLPSVIVSAIEGIYYLPGVTRDTVADTWEVEGVTLTAGAVAIPHVKADGSTEGLDLINAAPTAYTSGGIYTIAPTLGGDGIVRVPYKSGLSITITNFMDIYYKKYNLYIPYIGTVDIPISRLISYSYSAETIEININYVYNLADGSISAEWQTIPGNLIAAWQPLPKIPLTLSTSGVSFYQTDATRDLSIMGAGINGVVNIAGSLLQGNILSALGSGVGTGLSILSAGAKADISRNIAAAGNLTTTQLSGSAGWFYHRFYLSIEEICTATAYYVWLEAHGYPQNNGSLPYTVTGNIKYWLDYTGLRVYDGWGVHRAAIIRDLMAHDYITINHNI